MSRLDEYNERRRLDGQRTKDRKRRDAIPQAVLDAKVIGKPCRVCAATVGRRQFGESEAHHLVPRGRLRGADLNHAENIIPLCHEHHQDHHTTAHSRVPRQVLNDDEWTFLIHHEPSAWVNTWYPDA